MGFVHKKQINNSKLRSQTFLDLLIQLLHQARSADSVEKSILQEPQSAFIIFAASAFHEEVLLFQWTIITPAQAEPQ